MNTPRLYVTILLSVVLLGGHCGPIKPDPIQPTDSDKCDDACERLRLLGCDEGNDVYDAETDARVTCEIFCLETQGKGHALNPTCVAHIESCDDLERVTSEPGFCDKLIKTSD